MKRLPLLKQSDDRWNGKDKLRYLLDFFPKTNILSLPLYYVYWRLRTQVKLTALVNSGGFNFTIWQKNFDDAP